VVGAGVDVSVVAVDRAAIVFPDLPGDPDAADATLVVDDPAGAGETGVLLTAADLAAIVLPDFATAAPGAGGEVFSRAAIVFPDFAIV